MCWDFTKHVNFDVQVLSNLNGLGNLSLRQDQKWQVFEIVVGTVKNVESQ